MIKNIVNQVKKRPEKTEFMNFKDSVENDEARVSFGFVVDLVLKAFR